MNGGLIKGRTKKAKLSLNEIRYDTVARIWQGLIIESTADVV